MNTERAEDKNCTAPAKDSARSERNIIESAQDTQEHVIRLWQPFRFNVKRGYDYTRTGIFQTTRYIMLRSVAQMILNISNRFFIGLKVTGWKNLMLMGNGGAVVVCNHVHVMDCTVVDCALPHKRVYYTTLDTNFQIPVVRHVIRTLGAVPLSKNPACLSELFDEMKRALKKGRYVCFYPEGVLIPFYKGVRSFKDGAFRLAAEAGCPVIPMAISFRDPKGIYRLYKKKQCVTLHILPPVFADDTADLKTQAGILKRKCYDTISEAVAAEDENNAKKVDEKIRKSQTQPPEEK